MSQDRHAACHDALASLMRAQLDIVKSAHQQFCARLNSFAPAVRMPEEVLLAICHSLPAHARIAATHVCQRWRQTLLGAAGMWTSIEIQGTGDLHALPELLHRAGFAPVDIVSWGVLQPPQFIEALQSIGRHMRHVRSLRISAITLNEDDDASGPYSIRFAPAPMLQQLVIQWPYVNTELYISWDNASANDFTQLRHVDLLKLPDVSFVTLFSAVQALSLTVPNELALTRLNDVVHHCPQLRALSIHLISRPSDQHMAMDPPQRADDSRAPHLDSLMINTSSYSEQHTLRLLEFIGSANIPWVQVMAPNYVATHETLHSLVHELDGIESARVHEEWVHFTDRRRFSRWIPIIGPRELAPHAPLFFGLRELTIELAAWAALTGAGIQLPSLRHLTVTGDTRAVVRDRAGWPVCPSLHDVTYSVPCPEDGEEEHLRDAFDFVAAIANCPRPLPHLVVVGITPDWDDDIVFGSLENLVHVALGERRALVDKLEVRERADARSA